MRKGVIEVRMMAAFTLMLPTIAWSEVGSVQKIEVKSHENRAEIIIAHSGQGKFRLLKDKALPSAVLEATGLALPAPLARLQDLSASGSPLLQVASYSSHSGNQPVTKVTVRFKRDAEISSSTYPGRYVIELTRKSLPDLTQAALRPDKATDVLRRKSAALEKDEDIAKKLVEVLNAPSEEKKYFGSPVTIAMNEVSIREVLKLLAEYAGLNIICDTDVETKRVSVNLYDVPWDQVLDIIMVQNVLKASVIGGVVRLMTQGAYTAELEARNKEMLLAEASEPVIMAVIPLSFVDAGQMQRMLTTLLSDKAQSPEGLQRFAEVFNRGKIETDSRTNSLIVTNTKDFIERVRRLVKELDVAVPQVLIDSKIVIAKENFSRSMGVLWQGHLVSESGLAGAASGFGGGSDSLTAATSTFTVSSAPGSLGFGVGFGASDRANLRAALSLSEINGYAKTVASPRVVVANNKQATISDGQNITIALPGNGTQASSNTQVNAALSLTVTPQVTSHGSVQLKNLSVSKGLPSVSGNTVTVDSKQLVTDVLVDSGGTLVLGGIYQLSTTTSSGGIPLLKDLPFIGQLFRQDVDSKQKDELMVFITPQILEAEGAAANL